MVRNIEEVKIEKLIFGGLSLARIDGKAVFVEGAVPGEKVSAEFSGKKGGIEVYTVKEILVPSKYRRDPICKFYNKCGGCDWLHIDYDYQRNSKREIFVEQLRRVGKVEDIPEIKTISADEFGYRIRAQFKVNKKNMEIGFFKKESNDIVNIDNCPLLCSSLNDLLLEKTDILNKIDDNCRQIKLIATANSVVSFPILESYTKENSVVTIDDNRFLISGKNFFQSNKFLLVEMGNWVRERAKGDTFIDMYGGLGFFSVFLGAKFKRGILVESDTKMANAAQKNFKRNNLKNIKALAISSEKFFLQKDAKTADCIIVDPPRPGLSKKVRLSLGELLPKQLIYISCNPSTQARDVGYFINYKNYKIKDAVLFDLYPNTHHMETGLILER